MEGHIVFPAEAVGYCSPDEAIGVETRRVVELHAEINAENEERQVETQTYAIGPRYLLVELIQAEGAMGLRLVVADGPHVAGIGKSSQLEDRPDAPTVLEIEVELDITHLVVVGSAGARTAITARAERAGRPRTELAPPAK